MNATETSKEFTKALLEEASELSKARAPISTFSDELFDLGIGEAILTALSENDKLNKRSLRKQVKSLSKDGYNECFFDKILTLYTENKYVIFNESENYYRVK